jgi:hyperosmotically inducible protein
MRIDRKFLVLGMTLAGALSVVLAGCSDPQSAAPVKTSVGTEVDDTLVTTKVKTALLADADVKSFDLKVETRKGAVQLSGFVDNQAQIERAVAVTRSVAGVSSVENNVSLKAGSSTVGNTIDDGIITGKIKSALLADPNVKSFDIAVATSKGSVQLSGYVDNQAQIDEALAIARNVEGVTHVGNEMSIKR